MTGPELPPLIEAPEAPPGISILRGFDHRNSQRIVTGMMNELKARVEFTDPSLITLLLPADGSVFFHWQFITSGIAPSFIAGVDVRWAAKNDTLIKGENPYVLSSKTINTRQPRTFIIGEDIVDSVAVYDWMRELIVLESVPSYPPLRPELWAFSRKPTTNPLRYGGWKGSAVFPRVNGVSPWSRSGLGMDDGRITRKTGYAYGGEEWGRLYSEIQALERLAAVSVFGELAGIDPETYHPLPGSEQQAQDSLLAYREYLIRNSFFGDTVMQHPTFSLLTHIDRMSSSEKLQNLSVYHSDLVSKILQQE